MLVENHQFEPTLALFGDPIGVMPLEFRRDFWRQKTGVFGLSYGVVCAILCFTVLIQFRLVTDGRRTDGHTHDGGIYRASVASRCKN